MEFLRKQIVLIFCWLAWGTVANAQNVFFKSYSSGDADVGEGICQLPDSSYLITGSSGGFGNSSSQLFVMKTTKTGEKLWIKNYGGSEGDAGRRIFAINDTIYVLGRTMSFDNSMEIYFLKLNNQGDIISEKTIGTSNYDWLEDAVFTPKDSTFLLYGFEQANDDFVKWRTIQKVNRNGEVTALIERKQVPLDTKVKKIKLINDTLFAISGNDWNETRNHFDGFVQIYDYLGNQQMPDITYYENANRDFCFNDVAFSEATQDRYFITGTEEYEENDTLFSVYKLCNFKLASFTITTYTTAPDKSISSLEYILKHRTDDMAYLFIERAKKSTFGIIDDGKYYDERLFRYNGDFTLNWSSNVVNVSSFGDDITNQVITTLDNGFISVGYHEGYSFMQKNIFLNKIGANFESVPNFQPPIKESIVKVADNASFDGITIYPNPVESILKIDSEITIDMIQVFSITGQLILTTNQHLIDLGSLDAGSYILKLIASDHIYTQTILKK